MRKYDLKPGDKFGCLTITGDRETRNKVIYEKCVCECGNEKRVNRYHLIRGNIKSCGCLAKEISAQKLIKANTKHGLFGTKIYRTFMGARGRCNNPNNQNYHNYGGRGIKFLWDSFEDFVKDMKPSLDEHLKLYSNKDTTLDRIDVNGDYCKENCRWATNSEQQENKRNCKSITYNGVKFLTLSAFSEAIGKPKYIVTQRCSYGRTSDEIAEVPVGMNRHQFYGDNKYKPMSRAKKVEYNGVTYPSIKDFCVEMGIKYYSYSNLVSRGTDKKDAIEKLLNKKFNTDGCKINFVN